MLADNGGGDLEAVEAVFVGAAAGATQQVRVKEEAGVGILAAEKASDDKGREPGDEDYADEFLAFNEASTVKIGASASCHRVSGLNFKERGAAASDEARTGTKTKAAAGLASSFLEGDKSKMESADAFELAGTGTTRKAADGLFHGEDMHGEKFKVKCEAAAGAVMGASGAGKEDDAGDLMSKQLGAAELALEKGYTTAQFEAALKAVNAIGPVAALVTTRPANPTQSRGRRARPCRRVVLSGNTRPGRKPRRAHTHGGDRGTTPRATNTSCVTGSLLARVEGLEATLAPRPLIPSVPLRPPENPPQTPARDPQKTLRKPHLRHPQRNLRKPSPQGTWGQSQRKAVQASDTALSSGGGRVPCDTLAAPRCQGRGVILVNGPSRVYTKLGPELGACPGIY